MENTPENSFTVQASQIDITCLKRQTRSILGTQIEETSSEKESTQNSNFKKRDSVKKRVSFGGKQEYEISPLKKPTESIEVPPPQLLEAENEFLAVDYLSQKVQDSLDTLYNDFTKHYKKTLESVKQLGIDTSAPSEEDIQFQAQEINLLSNQIKSLEVDSYKGQVSNEKEIHKLKVEQHILEDSLESLKKEDSLNSLKKLSTEKSKLVEMFETLLHLKSWEVSKGLFKCTALDKDFEFQMQLSNKVTSYKPLTNKLPSNHILNCEISDLSKYEVPMHFIRIFKVINSKP